MLSHTPLIVKEKNSTLTVLDLLLKNAYFYLSKYNFHEKFAIEHYKLSNRPKNQQALLIFHDIYD